jgi:hypothetical protein
VDFTAASSEIGVVVKRLPQVVDGFASRFGTGIDEYTDFRLKYFTNTIEKPSMGIDLFLVLGLQDQDDLDRHEVVRVFATRQNQLRSGINRKLCGVLEDMSDGILSVDLLFHNTVLIYTDRGQNIQNGLVHRLETVDNQSDSDPLPARATLLCGPPPVFRLLSLADVTDVQHDAMKGACVEGLVFVIRGDSNQEICLPRPHFLTEGPSIRFREIIWITGCSGVPHVRELGRCSAGVLGLDGTVDWSGDLVFGDEVTSGEFHLARYASLDRLPTPPSGINA